MPLVKVAKPRVSFSDLLQMPEDGRRLELYDGEVFEMPSPMPRHQVAADNIKQILARYSLSRGGLSLISPIDIVFSEYDVVQPDVVFFAAARRHLVDFDKVIRDRPDLVVEVLSPGTVSNDRGRKLRMFAKYGVPEYWIADATRACLEMHVLRENRFDPPTTSCGEDVVSSPWLTGLTFPASDAFRLP
jgi:Uma2 family endonuclease